jgi:hypothetical protein
MAKTAAERQAAYRAKQAHTDSGERRINTWIDWEAYLALEALAIRYGVTRRVVLEALLMGDADKLSKLKPSKGFTPDVASISQAGALPRNDSSAITLPAIEELHSKKLLRNENKRGASKNNKQSLPVDEPKPSQATDAQYEFEL